MMGVSNGDGAQLRTPLLFNLIESSRLLADTPQNVCYIERGGCERSEFSVYILKVLNDYCLGQLQ
jgi:hypothetical protein